MPHPTFLGKVTAFITRKTQNEVELLLLKHPHAGVQIPGGTVEPEETPEQAVLREVQEETGLQDIRIKKYLGAIDELRAEGIWIVREKTKVYARPDRSSFDWAEFRSGIYVRERRRHSEFVQVTYEEWDQFPDPEYLTYQITGWVPISSLCKGTRRHFYHLTTSGAQHPNHWNQPADHHIFELFWSPIQNLPKIVAPQNTWLAHIQARLGYTFDY